jgi:hypothetical protein
MLWPKEEFARELNIEQMKTGVGYPYVLHYAGFSKHPLRDIPLNEILFFYQSYYYSFFLFGSFLSAVSTFKRSFVSGLKKDLRKVIKRKSIEKEKEEQKRGKK